MTVPTTTDEPPEPKVFHLHRAEDVTGVSGTGRVADGIRWSDGTVTLKWLGRYASEVSWPRGLEAVRAVHGHDGRTEIVWHDRCCPFCFPHHEEPTSRAWGVYVAGEVDGDGQPTHLRVGPSDGSHVAQADADWLWHLIRTARPAPVVAIGDTPVDIPGWAGSVGPFPGQYRDLHVYARDVHSPTGSCVCGSDLWHRVHVQAAPGVNIPAQRKF